MEAGTAVARSARADGRGDAVSGEAPGAWTSLPGMLFDLAGRRQGRPMLRHWRDGGWRRTSWAAFARAAVAVAAGLRARGVSPGDRVVLACGGRPEFLIADTAIMAIGAVTVPAYVTGTLADQVHLLRDSGARAAIAETPALAALLRAASAAEGGGLDLLACIDGAPPGTVPFADLLAAPADVPALLAEVARIPAGRLACLIYTSGTGGAPRGVMLPHRAMLANRAGIARITERLALDGEAYLSFLPPSHAYEHTVGSFLLPSLGMELVYSRGAEHLAAEFQDVRPAFVTAVPRLFEVLRGRILAQVARRPEWRRRLFGHALALGRRRLGEGPPLGPLARLADAALDRLVRRAVRARFGGRLVAMVSGGARLEPDLALFFLALGVPVIQGYGQTEAGPVVSVNTPWENRPRTVGRPLPGVEARIAPDGEVLLRGALVMDGYWGDEAATASALRPDPADPGGGPWLHTGDLGALEGGFLSITDRKRDILKTPGGEMVSPGRIESRLMAEAEVAQAVVGGEGLPGIVALLVPAEGVDEAGLAAAVARVNAGLQPHERVRRLIPCPPFTQADGLLTASQKIRRRAVLERHAALLGGGRG